MESAPALSPLALWKGESSEEILFSLCLHPVCLAQLGGNDECSENELPFASHARSRRGRRVGTKAQRRACEETAQSKPESRNGIEKCHFLPINYSAQANSNAIARSWTGSSLSSPANGRECCRKIETSKQTRATTEIATCFAPVNALFASHWKQHRQTTAICVCIVAMAIIEERERDASIETGTRKGIGDGFSISRRLVDGHPIR